MINKRKSIAMGVIVIAAVFVLFLLSQTPTVISATISPEVIVKGQSQEVTVIVVAKPRLLVNPGIKAIMAERGYKGTPKTEKDWIKYFSVFRLNSKTLGYLAKQDKDQDGNVIYKGTFTINHPIAVTAQIQPTNLFGMNLLPKTTPELSRLAITTRSTTIPPDPGEAGKATLEGVDSDHDGLRDDVQREIMFLAPESEKMRMALGAYAKVEQTLASSPNLSKEESNAFLEKISAAGACISALQELNDRIIYSNYAREIRKTNIVLNTPEREKVSKNNYWRADLQFGGFAELSRCSFNPSDYAD
jgi:hypothetical protein